MRLCVFVLILFVFSACGSDGDNQNSNNANNQLEPGERVYTEPAASGNVFTCEACHAIDDADDVPRRAGHPIGGAPDRATFKNGQLTDFLDAVNSCREEWMGADVWTDDDSDYTALSEFLAGKGDGEELSFEIVQPPTDFSAGDAERGRTTFNESCARCHGQDGGGGALAPGIAGNGLSVEYVAQRIRLSGLATSPIYDGLTGGRMPFWSASRISDDEVVDVATYIFESEMVVVNNTNNTNNQNNQNNGRQCDATHSRVGASFDFTTRFHQVAGTATVIDDCTIEVTNFTYDGTGIDVRFYNGIGSPPDYNAGQAVSGDLIRSGGYDNETVTIKLPEGLDLDDVDGLSVWCVDVGVSFGDGAF